MKLERALIDPDIQLAFQAGDGYDALRATLAVLNGRIAMYSGAFWSEYSYGIGYLSSVQNRAIRWNLDPAITTIHCETCLEYGDTTYESWDAMMAKTNNSWPAHNTRCLNNCRCSLEVIEA